MAGLAGAWTLNDAKSADECVALCTDKDSKAGVRYARLFAEADGRGSKEQQAFAEMSKVYGNGKAASLRAICWFLYWGSYTGNTLNGTLGFKAKKKGASPIFEYTFLAYYGFLFYGLINLVSLMVKVAPKVPKWFSAAFGVVLASIAGSFFAPLGLIGMAVGSPKATVKQE